MKQKYGENPGSNKYLYTTLNGNGPVRAPVAAYGLGSLLPFSLTFRLTSILLIASEKDLEKRIKETGGSPAESRIQIHRGGLGHEDNRRNETTEGH